MEVIDSVPKLSARRPDSHKGTYGRILVIAGSRGMSGAAVLCGTAALRGGAGLVQVAAPVEVTPIIAAGNPCYMTAALNQDMRGRFAASAVDEIVDLSVPADVVAIGPGIGHSDAMPRLLQGVLERVKKPLVIDADGLNAAVNFPIGIWLAREAPTILTPHPGEFARLSGLAAADVKTHREELANAFAAERNVVLALKGHATIVTDGRRVYRNTTGNPGMATGGTGDILTGLIAALVGQGLHAFDATVLGVWAHGRAGDLAAARVGQVSLIATDVLADLPAALLEASETVRAGEAGTGP